MHFANKMNHQKNIIKSTDLLKILYHALPKTIISNIVHVIKL